VKVIDGNIDMDVNRQGKVFMASPAIFQHKNEKHSHQLYRLYLHPPLPLSSCFFPMIFVVDVLLCCPSKCR
jgi:hypothetical protein